MLKESVLILSQHSSNKHFDNRDIAHQAVTYFKSSDHQASVHVACAPNMVAFVFGAHRETDIGGLSLGFHPGTNTPICSTEKSVSSLPKRGQAMAWPHHGFVGGGYLDLRGDWCAPPKP